MTESYTFVEVRNNLSELVVRAQEGEHITITRYGKPAALLGPIPSAGEQTRTIKLASGPTSVTLSFTGPVVNLSPGDREWLFDLIDQFKTYEAEYKEREEN